MKSATTNNKRKKKHNLFVFVVSIHALTHKSVWDIKDKKGKKKKKDIRAMMLNIHDYFFFPAFFAAPTEREEFDLETLPSEKSDAPPVLPADNEGPPN